MSWITNKDSQFAQRKFQASSPFEVSVIVTSVLRISSFNIRMLIICDQGSRFEYILCEPKGDFLKLCILTTSWGQLFGVFDPNNAI